MKKKKKKKKKKGPGTNGVRWVGLYPHAWPEDSLELAGGLSSLNNT
jgi:hypothetical protein